MDHNIAPTDDAARHSRVLDGAMTVFLSYGYKRVTMDDIAQAADMSRPALYLLFKNKADIYRAIGQRLFEACTLQAEAVMHGPGSLSERLNGALSDVMITHIRRIADSPHGAELLDLKNELAVGMIDDWRAATFHTMQEAIAADISASGVDLGKRGLTVTGLADILLDGLDAIKTRAISFDEQRARVRQLVRVVELALEP